MIWMDVDATLAEVPITYTAIIDDTDFKTREDALTYDQAGLDLVWNFVTTAGAMSQTAVTPTTGGGDYDWTNQGNGIYSIGIPASGGASINNDTEGFGWFSGFATGVLPWSGPVIGFRAAGLNNVLVDSAYSSTRGLTGTAVPDAAADAAGGLPVSDAGGLDLDAMNTNVSSVLTDTGTTLPAQISGLNNVSTAQVNAEVVDALATDTYAEPGQEAPGATVSLSTKIGYLYKFLRNKIDNDGTTIQVYDDAGTTVDQKSTVSEAAGTVTRGEFGTGP